MLILTSPEEMSQWRKHISDEGTSIGFIPTMGSLHEGHASLIRESTKNNTHTVVSVFVNPTQFTNSEDFEKYPRDVAADESLLRSLDVDVLYSPSAAEMYPKGFYSSIDPGHIATVFEGASRPGHFNGVATVVVKLLNTVEPTNAYFGKKDRQQLAVIRQVVRDLDIHINIVGNSTVRDHDGLALSSRNSRLSPMERRAAVVVPESLQTIISSFQNGERKSENLIQIGMQVLEKESKCNVDYVVVVDPDTMKELDTATESSVVCVAATFGSIRLIDNTELSNFV
jgi:pantoate--beta-alanine ligase